MSWDGVGQHRKGKSDQLNVMSDGTTSQLSVMSDWGLFGNRIRLRCLRTITEGTAYELG